MLRERAERSAEIAGAKEYAGNWLWREANRWREEGEGGGGDVELKRRMDFEQKVRTDKEPSFLGKIDDG